MDTTITWWINFFFKTSKNACRITEEQTEFLIGYWQEKAEVFLGAKQFEPSFGTSNASHCEDLLKNTDLFSF